jgi:hypothetical protein
LKADFQIKVNPRIKSLKDLATLTVRDMQNMTKDVDSDFTENMLMQFATQGTSSGAMWQALSPAYKKWKKRKFPGKTIMNLTGQTLEAFTQKSSPHHVATFALLPKALIQVGANGTGGKTNRGSVAHFHKAPTADTPNPLYNKKLPNRDVIRASKRQRKGYNEVIKNYLVSVKLDRVRRALQSWVK